MPQKPAIVWWIIAVTFISTPRGRDRFVPKRLRRTGAKTEQADAKTFGDGDFCDADGWTGCGCPDRQFVIWEANAVARAGRSPPAAGRPGTVGERPWQQHR